MSIPIPAVVDGLLADIQASLRPIQDVATNIASSPLPAYVLGNRAADLIRQLTELIDSGTLTETTGGSDLLFVDAGAFTGVDSLVGATFTFDPATPTAALRGVAKKVLANGVNSLTLATAGNPLPAVTAIGDFGTLEFDAVDDQLVVLEGSRGSGGGQSNPYSDGRVLINLIMLTVEKLGGTLPGYMTVESPVNVNTYNGNQGAFGNPHGGDGARGHGGGLLIADLLEVVRDTVAAYTAPA